MSETKAQLWGGRFEQGLHPLAAGYSFSIAVDTRLAAYDIRTNLAHAKALSVANILTEKEYQELSVFLLSLINRFKANEPGLIQSQDEDIHSCIERLTTESLGDLGKKMHTGKSRNDQVITDVRLYLMDSIRQIDQALLACMHQLWAIANAQVGQLFPGFTHFQPAQPVLLAHHFLAYVEMLSRDHERFLDCLKRVDCLPLGSGAIAGNNYGLDRQLIAKELGFSKVSQNSMDAVADRDFMLEFINAAATTLMHVSRLCEELVLWSSPLLGFIQIGDAFTTGSSLMPQKKNPDIAELIRGRSGRVTGHLVNLYQTLKALPLTYNRDLQEDKLALFDSADVCISTLSVLTEMLKTVQFYPEKIAVALTQGYLNATEVADYLVKKGTPFREAHDVTGKVVLKAISLNKRLDELPLQEFQLLCASIQPDIYDAISLKSAVENKNIEGGTATLQVQKQLNRIKEQYQW